MVAERPNGCLLLLLMCKYEKGLLVQSNNQGVETKILLVSVTVQVSVSKTIQWANTGS